jgi:hypothetical protein
LRETVAVIAVSSIRRQSRERCVGAGVADGEAAYGSATAPDENAKARFGWARIGMLQSARDLPP